MSTTIKKKKPAARRKQARPAKASRIVARLAGIVNSGETDLSMREGLDD
ncbi:MAG: hypothetical protein LBC18_11230 [Opitutaceae bacterium]|jgi:hypothetical protein|nr:hypothetical protein [Opitutaceae bacterium]